MADDKTTAERAAEGFDTWLRTNPASGLRSMERGTPTWHRAREVWLAGAAWQAEQDRIRIEAESAEAERLRGVAVKLGRRADEAEQTRVLTREQLRELRDEVFHVRADASDRDSPYGGQIMAQGFVTLGRMICEMYDALLAQGDVPVTQCGSVAND